MNSNDLIKHFAVAAEMLAATVGLFMFVVILVVPPYVILRREIKQPSDPLTIALRHWQAGLGAYAGLILGLAGVAYSVLGSAYYARQAKIADLTAESRALAMTLAVDAAYAERWVESLDFLAREARIEREKKNPKWCEMFFMLAKGRGLLHLGLLDTQKSNLGRIGNEGALIFVELDSRRREIESMIKQTDDWYTSNGKEACPAGAPQKFDRVVSSLDELRPLFATLVKALDKGPVALMK